MSLLRRGFKTWCENAARGYRREFGIEANGALNPRLLAASMNVKIWTPAEVPALPVTALRQLNKDTENWSAVTICFVGRLLIIVNDKQSPQRQNNSIMHEMAHIILKHEAAKAFTSADGLMFVSNYDKMQEEEADCMSATLLVPREALLALLKQGYDDIGLAAHFDVSINLLRMRVNRTGVNKQLGRRRSA